MDFETFWKDERIPKRMKRCGPAPVRKFLNQRGLNNPEGYEQILSSLPGYERTKPDYADFCMLSTYINQERDLVEWDEMDEPESAVRDMSIDERREYGRKLMQEKLRVVK